MHSRLQSINEFKAVSKTIYNRMVVILVLALARTGGGGEPPAAFLGADSCASSNCHGGGGAKQNQFLVWSLQDVHARRPAATLTTARSKQIAEALELKDPAADARCTACHSPLLAVPEQSRGGSFNPGEAVSCESCHGPAEHWLRAHTRSDWTRADRTSAGLRDLQNLYVRANTCVACHQVMAQPLLLAGHPELIFELDGQSVAEPKHWGAEKHGPGAQAWLVGQAVALREMSWELAHEKAPSQSQINRWAGLAWLLQTALPNRPMPPPPPTLPGKAAEAAPGLQSWSDEVARDAAAADWSPERTHALLSALADSGPSFHAAVGSRDLLARRAERLVLALDRLVTALPELKSNAPAQSALNELFQLAQSVSDFDPVKFTAALERFSRAMAGPAPAGRP